MPRIEECIEAQGNVRKWAIQALVQSGHSLQSAELLMKYMPYEEQIVWAEKVHGKIYRGAYSPY
jgi:hypothetical protein